MSIIKAIFKEGLRETVAQAFWTWVWPVVMTTGATGLLYLQGLPWGYLSVGALAAFAFSVWGVLGVSRWQFYRNPEGKLRFSRALVGIRRRPTPDNPTIAVKLGFALDSIAEFPITFRVEEITSRIGARLNPNPEYANRELTIDPKAGVFFYDDSIDIPSAEINEETDALLTFRLKYGRLGHLKYDFSHSIKTVLGRGVDGTIAGGSYYNLDGK